MCENIAADTFDRFTWLSCRRQPDQHHIVIADQSTATQLQKIAKHSLLLKTVSLTLKLLVTLSLQIWFSCNVIQAQGSTTTTTTQPRERSGSPLNTSTEWYVQWICSLHSGERRLQIFLFFILRVLLNLSIESYCFNLEQCNVQSFACDSETLCKGFCMEQFVFIDFTKRNCS